MTTAWFDEIFSTSALYLYVSTWINTSKAKVFEKRREPRNAFERFHARQGGIDTVLDYDALDEFIAENDGMIFVRDHSDMTLLRLLYAAHHNPRLRLYLGMPGASKTKAINIEKLRGRIQSHARLYSNTSFNNFLFLAPMVLLTGLPNQLSLQQSANAESLTILLQAVNLAKGRIYNIEAEALDIVRFKRVIDHLAEDEQDNISTVVAFARHRKQDDVYDPRTLEFERFVEYFYAYNDFVDEPEEIPMIVMAYVQTLMEFSKFMRGRPHVMLPPLPESPLLHSMRECFGPVGIKYVCTDPTLQPTFKSTLSRRLNRYPSLRP